jgi:delta24-sterol reductase
MIKALPYVSLTLERVGNYDEMARRSIAVAETAGAKAPQYYEGLMFSPSHGALIYGDMCDGVPAGGRVYRPVTDWWDKWFHRFVEHETAQQSSVRIYIPIADYVFRYSRSLFWEVELMAPFTGSDWFHKLFGWLMPPSVRHLKMLQVRCCCWFVSLKRKR